LNLFKYFVSSIPYGESFTETVDYLNEEYKKILSTSLEHKESINAKLDSVASNIDTYILNINNIDESVLIEVKEDLNHVIEVLGKILSLTFKYPAYFSKYINWFEQNDNSLRSRYNSICNYVEDIESIGIDDLSKMLKHIRDIKSRFCNNSLAPYKIFYNPYTFKFINEFNKYLEEFKKDELDFVVIISTCEEVSIAFPQYILEETILKNLFNNFREYADKKQPIIIKIERDKDIIALEIKNGIAKNSTKEGSYIGTHLIKNLNECPSGIFEYDNNDNHTDKQLFVQTLKFKILNI